MQAETEGIKKVAGFRSSRVSELAGMAAFIREYYAEGIALGETAAELRERGRWLRENVGEDLSGSVAAFTALVRQRAARVVEGHGLSEVVSRDQLIAATFHPSPTTRESLQKGLEELAAPIERGDEVCLAIQALRCCLLGLDSVPSSDAVVGHANPRTGGPPTSVLQAQGLVAQSLHEIDGPPRPDEGNLSGGPPGTVLAAGVTGDKVTYDVPVKRAWRATLASFLDRQNLGAAFYREAWVLCNPSQQPEPEVSLFLERGVRPDRVIAVERSSEVFATFKANCDRLGIHGVFGTLEDVIPRIGNRLGIVSLDFVGQLSTNKLVTMQQLPLARRAVVLLNYRIGRETDDVQDFMRHVRTRSLLDIATRPQTPHEYAPIDRTYGKSQFAKANCLSHVEIEKEVGATPIKEVRTETAGKIMLGLAGTLRQGNPLGYPEDSFRSIVPTIRTTVFDVDSEQEIVVASVLSEVCRGIVGALASAKPSRFRLAPRRFSDRDDESGYGLFRTMSKGIFVQPWSRLVTEEYEYRSQSGSGKSTFYTTLGLLESPWDKNAEWRDAAVFVFRCLSAILNGSFRGFTIDDYEIVGTERASRNQLVRAVVPGAIDRTLELHRRREPVFGCSIRAKDFWHQLRQMEFSTRVDVSDRAIERRLIVPAPDV